MKETGKEVKSKEEADFIRIIQEPDSGDVKFKLLEYYRSGKKKTLGYVSAFEPRLIFTGAVTSYDSLGRKTQIMNYEDGKLSGIAVFYHPNGKIRRKAEYLRTTPRTDQMVGISSSLTDFIFNTHSKVEYDADSNGVVNVENGNGHVKEIQKMGDDIFTEEGNYVDGLKNGTWTGSYASKKAVHKEIYNDNKLISGETLQDGKTYTYTSNMEAPEFPGGQKAWNNYIASSTKYPADAYKDNITGNVFASFVVGKSGRIEDIVIERPVSPSLDQEAKRVLQYAPKWTPGKQRGVPVRVKYNQNFNFRL